VKADGMLDGTITGLSTDPILMFNTTTYANQKSANVSGAEVNVQHMFGQSGFGLQANYTYVHSPLKYNNADVNDQFAILGLSNSANWWVSSRTRTGRYAWRTTGATRSWPPRWTAMAAQRRCTLMPMARSTSALATTSTRT
jgi:hypothetical protein